MHNLCRIIFATNTILSDLMRITLKHQVKLQPHPFKIFLANVEKVQKRINYA